MSEKKKSEPKTATAKKTQPKTEPDDTKSRNTKSDPKPKEEGLVVFALRMTEAERVALHKSAGPANASAVMRSLAGAFVREDRAVFESIIEDARKLRA